MHTSFAVCFGIACVICRVHSRCVMLVIMCPAHVGMSAAAIFSRPKSKSTQGLVCRSGRAMGRFSLGSGDSGRFARYPPANPTLELASSGRREVRARAKLASSTPVTGTKRNITAAFEPVKKACKFGDGSRGSLQSKDESQVGPASESDWAHRQRHPVRVPDCARCAFLDMGPALRAGHGSYKHEVHGERARTCLVDAAAVASRRIVGSGLRLLRFSCAAPC